MFDDVICVFCYQGVYFTFGQNYCQIFNYFAVKKFASDEKCTQTVIFLIRDVINNAWLCGSVVTHAMALCRLALKEEWY